MPETSLKEHDSQIENSSSSVLKWCRRFHFSGRVIMCSVLFGFGLILIGGLLFAIHTDDDPKQESKDSPSNVPTKAPTNYVGPAVMGVGCFVVVLGVIMCLFETQVCRKRTGDSSPLISERPDQERNKSEPTDMPSASRGHKTHRHDKRKNGTSPKRSKGHNHKHQSKERHQKTPSPKSPPISIEKPKNILTSSEDNFLTPPNTLDAHTAVVQNHSQDAGNQTSASLLKSFTSSDPSWTQSTEFQTPSTSFGEQSMSLENSIEVSENASNRLFPTELTPKPSINVGFLTPMTFDEQKIKNMSSKIQNHENDLQQSMPHNNDETYNTVAVSETANIKSSEHDSGMVNIDNTPEKEKSTNVSSKKDDIIINEDTATDEVSELSTSNLENTTVSSINNNTNGEADHIISISNAPTENLHDNEVVANNAEEESKDVQEDFESSTSSNVTITPPSISHKEELNEKESEPKVDLEDLTPQQDKNAATFECSSNNEYISKKESNHDVQSNKLTENGAEVKKDELVEKDDISKDAIEKTSQKYS